MKIDMDIIKNIYEYFMEWARENTLGGSGLQGLIDLITPIIEQIKALMAE
jgi:hypothetical protein